MWWAVANRRIVPPAIISARVAVLIIQIYVALFPVIAASPQQRVAKILCRSVRLVMIQLVSCITVAAARVVPARIAVVVALSRFTM
jgi:hypothetical protein